MPSSNKNSPKKSVNLSDLVFSDREALIEAEWKGDSSPFVLVKYSIDGKIRPLAIRLDIDKQVAIDKTDNLNGGPFDEFIQEKIPEITKRVTLIRSLEVARPWRNDAFEKAAEIAERHGCPNAAKDIRALIS